MDKYKNNEKEVLEYAYYLKNNNFEVYIPEKKSTTDWTTYFLFSYNEKIGYVQKQLFDLFEFSTKHKANKNVGTGYFIEKNIKQPTTKEAMNVCNMTAPNWADKSDYKHIEKYKGFSEYFKNPTNNITKYIKL